MSTASPGCGSRMRRSCLRYRVLTPTPAHYSSPKGLHNSCAVSSWGIKITLMGPSDLKSLLPDLEPESRRHFLVTRLAAGFALAVSPIGAQTITTDTKGLTAGPVMIPVEGGQIPAYRAAPSRGANFPIVLVVQ